MVKAIKPRPPVSLPLFLSQPKPIFCGACAWISTNLDLRLSMLSKISIASLWLSMASARENVWAGGPAFQYLFCIFFPTFRYTPYHQVCRFRRFVLIFRACCYHEKHYHDCRYHSIIRSFIMRYPARSSRDLSSNRRRSFQSSPTARSMCSWNV